MTTESISIAGISEVAIANYFITINQEKFAETASLFAEDGEMLAPFKEPIIGREKIASYLEKEATGMKLLPVQGICETEDEVERFKVLGKVRTSMFSVNVAWYFTLNPQRQLTSARIKLLASPQELLSLQNQRDSSSE